MMIAWSDYFKSYIRLEEKIDNDNWTFRLCSKNGRRKLFSRKMKANTSFDKFNWIFLIYK